MTLSAGIAIYFLIWWIVLFAVLPFGVRSQHEAGEVEEGTDPGAPLAPQLLKKALITTVISGIIFGAGYYAHMQGWLTLENLPMPFGKLSH
jgi:predicted secreted protein